MDTTWSPEPSMDRPCDSRQTCGHDLRIHNWTPSDLARADALVLEHDGMLSNYIGSTGAGLGVEWLGRDGRHIVLTGRNVPALLGELSTMLRDGDERVTGPATFSPPLS